MGGSSLMQRMVLRFIVPNLKFFSSYLAYELHKRKKQTQGHELKYHPDLFKDASGIATSEMYDASSNSFDATSSKMFRIQHPSLVVEDSHGKKFPLELYLVPEKNQVATQTVMVFASLNQIAINFAQVNIAQTAYFLRPLKGANPLNSTAEDMTPNVLNQAYLHPSHGFVPVADWNKWNAAYLQFSTIEDDKPTSKPLT